MIPLTLRTGLAMLLMFLAHYAMAQNKPAADSSRDAPQTWQPTAGVMFDPVPVLSTAGGDTGFVNLLSIDPKFVIRHKSGLGIVYSPHILTGGPDPGIYMHALTAGLERYGQPVFDIVADYSHYFFTGRDNGLPYTPLNNEFYGMINYKNWWVSPKLVADMGFGRDTTQSPAFLAYDVAVAGGVNHDFNWGNDKVNVDLIPALLLNAGTNEYFSFLTVTKYITHSKKFINYIRSDSVITRGKSGKTVTVTTSGNGKGRGRGHSGGTTGTGSGTGAGTGVGGTTTTTTSTTTTTATRHESFALTNLELSLEGDLNIGSFTLRPMASLFLPLGADAGTGIFGYWAVEAEYNF